MIFLGMALAANLGLMHASSGCAPQPQTLAAMRDCYRPLLVFTPSTDDPRYVTQLKAFGREASGLREREMLLVPVFAGTTGSLSATQAPTALLPQREQAALRKRFDVHRDEFRVVLVGKDGGEKFASATPASAEMLFGIVDGMPMRRQEREQRGK